MTLFINRRATLFLCCCGFAVAALPAPGRAQSLVYPLDAVIDAQGDILVADRKLPGVLRIHDGAVSVVVEGSKRFKEPLNAVWCVALDNNGAVLVGDSAARGIFRIDAEGKPQQINTSYVGIPIRMAVDAEGRIYVSDLETQRIWRFGPEGGEGEEFAVAGGIRGLAIDAQGRLWTACANAPQVVRYAADGTAETIVNEGPFEFPHQIAVSADGNTAYVVDGYAKAVWKVVPGEEPVQWASGAPLDNPTGLAWQGETLVIVDPRVPGLFQADAAGAVTPLFPAAP
jgi:sugar lactone lactonase YvrE